MKRTMIVTGLILVMTGGAIALHAERPQRGQFGPGAMRGPYAEHNFEQMAAVLELTDEQRSILELKHEQNASAATELRDRNREIHVALRGLLESERPNPKKVGELVIAGEEIRKQMREQHETMQTELIAILDDEQRVKFEALRDMREQRGGKNRKRGGGHGLHQGLGH